ncbi:MAG TPA: DUF3099 domain-containing protein [Candidatus Dietzia intestinigallinarum]|nr:DUF3099 domain-containing protein [Candidatus Dietzia intestinigallinarum]
MAPDFRRKRSGDRDDTSSPVLITGARESYRDELAARKKRYFILMSVRIPALLLAAGSLALWNNPWIALAIVAVSIPVPWIAVVGANDRPPLPKGQPRTYTAGRLGSPAPVALPPGLTGGPNTRERAAHDEPGEDRPGDDSSSGDGTDPRPRTDTDESDTTP